MSGRSRPSTVDAQWAVDRLRRASQSKRPVGDDLSIEKLGPVPPLPDEVRADAVWTAACHDTVTAAEQLAEAAEALGCTRAEVELARERLRQARRARQEAAA